MSHTCLYFPTAELHSRLASVLISHPAEGRRLGWLGWWFLRNEKWECADDFGITGFGRFQSIILAVKDIRSVDLLIFWNPVSHCYEMNWVTTHAVQLLSAVDDVVRMRVSAEQVPVAAHVLRERDTSRRRASWGSPHVQQTPDTTHRHSQGRLRRLRALPRAPRGRRRRPAAISEPGGRGRPPERLRRWRGRAAGCWLTVSASSGRRRQASPRWRSGRLMATTSAVSFYSHCLSSCLSLSFSLSVCGANSCKRGRETRIQLTNFQLKADLLNTFIFVFSPWIQVIGLMTIWLFTRCIYKKSSE